MDNPPDRPPVSRIQPETPEFPLTANLWGSDIDVYQVLGNDLDRIKASASSSGLYLTFFGIAFGAAISFGLVLATVDLLGPRTFAAFVALFALSLGATVFLGIKAYMEWRATQTEITQIKSKSRKLGTARGVFRPPPPPSSTPYTQDSTKQ